MKHLRKVLFLVLASVGIIWAISSLGQYVSAQELEPRGYLAVVVKPESTPTLTATPTPTSEIIIPTRTPTSTPTPTSEPPDPGDVNITTIFYDGTKGSAEPDEYVEIRNDGGSPVQLQGWTLRDEANHVFTFPPFQMQPGQVCRVYTNEVHPESCGFSYGSNSAIWNNSGDCADLRDSSGTLADRYCY